MKQNMVFVLAMQGIFNAYSSTFFLVLGSCEFQSLSSVIIWVDVFLFKPQNNSIAYYFISDIITNLKSNSSTYY